ncbi:uncharacterized protein LOC136034811 isoform X2 [Artemia franciscana]|uniref:uncharacterized protein LOC136034811 isoform X2 n=1 Tax=Artemia franciscana TaxID=6661 RepID=UPI0032DA480E
MSSVPAFIIRSVNLLKREHMEYQRDKNIRKVKLPQCSDIGFVHLGQPLFASAYISDMVDQLDEVCKELIQRSSEETSVNAIKLLQTIDAMLEPKDFAQSLLNFVRTEIKGHFACLAEKAAIENNSEDMIVLLGSLSHLKVSFRTYEQLFEMEGDTKTASLLKRSYRILHLLMLQYAQLTGRIIVYNSFSTFSFSDLKEFKQAMNLVCSSQRSVGKTVSKEVRAAIYDEAFGRLLTMLGALMSMMMPLSKDIANLRTFLLICVENTCRSTALLNGKSILKVRQLLYALSAIYSPLTSLCQVVFNPSNNPEALFTPDPAISWIEPIYAKNVPKRNLCFKLFELFEEGRCNVSNIIYIWVSTKPAWFEAIVSFLDSFTKPVILDVISMLPSDSVKTSKISIRFDKMAKRIITTITKQLSIIPYGLAKFFLELRNIIPSNITPTGGSVCLHFGICSVYHQMLNKESIGDRKDAELVYNILIAIAERLCTCADSVYAESGKNLDDALRERLDSGFCEKFFPGLVEESLIEHCTSLSSLFLYKKNNLECIQSVFALLQRNRGWLEKMLNIVQRVKGVNANWTSFSLNCGEEVTWEESLTLTEELVFASKFPSSWNDFISQILEGNDTQLKTFKAMVSNRWEFRSESHEEADAAVLKLSRIYNMANIIVDALTHLLQSNPNLTRNTTIPKDVLVNHIKLNNSKISELSIQKNLRDCVSSGEIMAYGGNFRLTDKKLTLLLERLPVDRSEKENTTKLNQPKDDVTSNLPNLPEDDAKAVHKVVPNLLKRSKKSEETKTQILERQKRQKRTRVPFDPSDDGSWPEQPKKRGRPRKKSSTEVPIQLKVSDDRLPCKIYS